MSKQEKIVKPGGISSPKDGSEKPAETRDETQSAVDKPVDKQKDVYSFPTQSRCPRCGTTDTIATSTQNKIQYRRCLRAICRHTYTVNGQKI